MNKLDKLGFYIKELPLEEPSRDFTNMVMNRVMFEEKKLPVKYQPLIGWQLWWKIFTGIILVIVGSILLPNFFPGNESPVLLQSINKLDFSLIFSPFQMLLSALNGVSLSFAAGMMAVTILLFADQVYTRFIAR